VCWYELRSCWIDDDDKILYLAEDDSYIPSCSSNLPYLLTFVFHCDGGNATSISNTKDLHSVNVAVEEVTSDVEAVGIHAVHECDSIVRIEVEVIVDKGFGLSR